MSFASYETTQTTSTRGANKNPLRTVYFTVLSILTGESLDLSVTRQAESHNAAKAWIRSCYSLQRGLNGQPAYGTIQFVPEGVNPTANVSGETSVKNPVAEARKAAKALAKQTAMEQAAKAVADSQTTNAEVHERPAEQSAV